MHQCRNAGMQESRNDMNRSETEPGGANDDCHESSIVNCKSKIQSSFELRSTHEHL